MRFIVLISPIFKFLINKYQSNISLHGVESDVLLKFKAAEMLSPSECRTFIHILTSIRQYLTDNNIQYQRDSLKKMIGDGLEWSGFLNIMVETKHDIYFCPYEPGSLQNLSNIEKKIGNSDLSDVRVIVSLNLDESEEIYSFFHQQLKLPVYPAICNNATSKWLKNITFAPFAPRAFYFPEGTCAADYNDKIIDLARRAGISRLIMKDEYDFDLRPILPYAVMPADRLDQACRVFYEKVKGIPNYGGIVLEEFLATGDAIEIVTLNVFNKIIRASCIVEKVKLKKFMDGGIYDTFIQENTMTATNVVPMNQDIIAAIDAIVARYYPFLLSGLEFVMYKGTPRIIDVNSVSNTLKMEKPIANLKPDQIFKEFVDRIVKMNNVEELEKQIEYFASINRVYDNLRKFGPAFFTGEKIVSLIDGTEKELKEFLVFS